MDEILSEPPASASFLRISEEAKKRIRQAMRRTLEQQLADVQKSLDYGDQTACYCGPWSMLTSDAGAWALHTRLSRELRAELDGHFSDDIIREVLLAAAGVKVSRTSLPEDDIVLLDVLAHQCGFSLLAGRERYRHRPDIGKGGACNTLEHIERPDERGGFRIVYIASNPSLAETAKLLEEVGEDELFGVLLGIPSCCREAFASFKAAAMAKQFDFIPLALGNTQGDMPYDFWLNVAASYFGRSLLSFFPCSFRCPSASFIARRTFEMLADCDDTWARSFLALQRTNILYTEYEGVYMFYPRLLDGSIHYGGKFKPTERNELEALIRRGDRLAVRGKNHVDIYRGSHRIGVIEGKDVAVCAFW